VLSPSRRRLPTVLVVLVLVVGVVGGVVAARRLVEGAQAADQPEAPVLLVTGYGGSTAALAPLRERLEDAGRTVVLVPAVGRNTGDLREQAEALDRVAERALDEHGTSTVDVVGYSAGGLVARLWVREHGGDEVARRVMTIGSPHHGTDLADLAASLGTCPRACRQMAPGSRLLQRLNAGDETPDGPQWVTVWSTDDRVAAPPVSARLDGALEVTVRSLCPDRRTSHAELPGDPVVLALLGSALGSDTPEVPDDVDCEAGS
jgi:triacylglycerol lipase